jgi:hypothetical protein
MGGGGQGLTKRNGAPVVHARPAIDWLNAAESYEA